MTVPRRSAKSGNSPSAFDLMAQKSAKKKAKKSAKPETGVLGSLRSTRPGRIGGERREAATATPPATATKPPAAKPSKPKAAKAKPAKKMAKPKAGKATVKPTKAVAPGPKAPPKRAPAAEPPRGTEIVTTAVQAAGELAQIGATVGGQLLRRAARRIPRP